MRTLTANVTSGNVVKISNEIYNPPAACCVIPTFLLFLSNLFHVMKKSHF